MILPRSESIIVEWAFLVGSVATVVVLALAVRSKLSGAINSARRSHVAFALLTALGWVSAFVFVRTHTGLGVLLLGGADYWVGRAAAAPDEEARQILAEVVGSSNYGVDAARAAVMRRPKSSERVRLFVLLANVAPTGSWRQRYLSLARSAEKSTQMSDPRPNSR